MTPIFSVGICSYNRHDLLDKAVESALAQQTRFGRFEIIVVDNSDTFPADYDFYARHGKSERLKYHRCEEKGLSRARNLCVEKSSATYIAFLDDDAVASVDWLQNLYDAFVSRPEGQCAVVGGRVNPCWEVCPPAWLLPPDIDHSDINNHEFPMVGNFSVVNWGGRLRPLATGEWLAGANLAFRLDTLKEAGCFDTGLGRKGNGHSLLSNEEGAVIRKIQKQGKAILYAPDAQVSHFIPKERMTPEWVIRRVCWQMVSDLMSEISHKSLSATEIEARFARFRNVKQPAELQALDAASFRSCILAYVALVEALLTGDVEQIQKISVLGTAPGSPP